MYGSYGSDTFGGSGYEFGYDYENSYASDSYYANSCEELDVLYQDIVADPSDTAYMSGMGSGDFGGMESSDPAWRDPALMNSPADSMNYGNNVAEAARMVAETCHQEKAAMTQHMHTCPSHAMLEMYRYPETNPATNNSYLHDFEDACHAAATRSGACDAAAMGHADWCTVKMSDGMMTGNADSMNYQNAANTLGDCINHYMHDGMDHEMNGMFHDVSEGTATLDDIMADTMGPSNYNQQTETFFQSTFDVSPGNPYGNADCSLDCAAYAADHYDAEMRTNDFEEYPVGSGNWMPRIKEWVYDGQIYNQVNYNWQNKAQCNVLVNIPEDSCSSTGAHAPTYRTLHKCQAMNDHGYNTELTGHMTPRALRSIRKLSAKNKNFGRRLSMGGNKKAAQKMQLRKLRQKQHFERRRRQLSAHGRRLSAGDEKLELLDVKYMVDSSRVVAPSTPKVMKLKAQSVHHTIKRKLKGIKNKFKSLRKLTVRGRK
jgi:hypothetical protein